jgi:hypothetical protein
VTMGLRVWSVAVLVAAGGLWLASGTQKEKPVLSDSRADAVRTLEGDVASQPNDAPHVRQLAQAYLDARSPGLAVSVVETSPEAVRGDVKVQHVYARALVEQGRNQDALAAEQRVLTQCAANAETASPCDSWLLASATRRADILKELVSLGVEDSQAQPEASALAYHNATREAHVVIQ